MMLEVINQYGETEFISLSFIDKIFPLKDGKLRVHHPNEKYTLISNSVEDIRAQLETMKKLEVFKNA